MPATSLLSKPRMPWRLILPGLMLVAASAGGCRAPRASDVNGVQAGGGAEETTTVDPARRLELTPVPDLARLTEVEVQLWYLRLDPSDPRSATLAGAWALTDQAAFPEVTLGAWQMNGVRAGLLSSTQAASLKAVLPPAVRVVDRQLNDTQPHLLRGVKTYEPGTRVELAIPPYAPRVETLRGGRVQLLAEVLPGDGSVQLTLTPQHHLPEASLMPRPAHEKLMDGRVYHELAMRVALSPDRLLMLGLDWPVAALAPVEPADVTEPGGETDDTTAEADTAETVTADPFREEAVFKPALIPTHLGRALFVQRGRGAWGQVLVLIRAKPSAPR